MASSSKPNVLIFGGLNTLSRHLAAFLVPLEGEAKVSHLRIVDKYSVAPPTTYVGAEFPKILAKPNVEYKQVNLTVAAAIPAAFDPPEGQEPFDYVFDLTGETRPDRLPEIQIQNTCHVARLLGLEAAKHNVKAYVRIHGPYYETKSAPNVEKVDIKPDGTVGTWWHETLRILAAIPNLNLVVLRKGFGYGPYHIGAVSTFLTVASVYGYLKKPMKALHSPGKHPSNTIHVLDAAGAAWACAEWMRPLGRQEANKLAGEKLTFHNEKSKVKENDWLPAPDTTPVCPLFNIVDDSNTTLLTLGQTCCSVFDTKFEFFNMLESVALKVSKDIVEEINEHHVGGWTEMITKSNPPIPNTPLSAYMEQYDLDKHVVGYDNNKIKSIVGYKLQKPTFEKANLQECIDKWREEKSWPAL